MEINARITLGGVYKTILSDGPCRVIGFDDENMFYNPYISTLNKWSLSSRPGSNCTYYRTWPQVFLKNAQFLREQPLTDGERSAFRPDLPLRLCQQLALETGFRG